MTALPPCLADDQQATPLAARVAAAAALGPGDPRAGLSARVPAGPFTLGADDAEESERPRRTARTQAFEIDLLPVTVARFSPFVESGAYRDRALWSDEGWELLERGTSEPAGGPTGRIERPRFFGDAAWSAYLHPAHPVVGVSLHEAEAFARWCGRRLPSEEEWERAARGEDGRAFPWGDAWDPARAHHRGGHRGTLPAGCFPAGRSPHGLWDCAGNVWEWTTGRFDGQLRTARGGGWNAPPPRLRCAARNAWPAEARFSHIGFRTAR